MLCCNSSFGLLLIQYHQQVINSQYNVSRYSISISNYFRVFALYFRGWLNILVFFLYYSFQLILAKVLNASYFIFNYFLLAFSFYFVMILFILMLYPDCPILFLLKRLLCLHCMFLLGCALVWLSVILFYFM